MYYPYFRGKQFELILLREKAQFLVNNNIHPIIEPVKDDFSSLTRTMKILNKECVDCSLIVNPQVGQKPISCSIIQKLIDDNFVGFKNISVGFILHAQSKIVDLVNLLQKYQNLDFSILHYGYKNGAEVANAIIGYNNVKKHIFIDGFAGKLYQRHVKKDGIQRILIRNGFKQRKKNSLYPPSEHFSDLHITFPDEGMDGFGDYLIVGDDYSEAGGPAYAVAIHLTYLDDGNDMSIFHFISDHMDSPTDPAGKFLEALSKLVKEFRKPKSLIFNSSACSEYVDLYNKKHYPGLGYVKKLSMQHHIELIAHYLKKSS